MLDKLYKQIVILSGKGGTGKTTLSSAFASLIDNKIIIDCDVDAANLHLVLKPDILNKHDFLGGKKASINKNKCDECGLCEAVCSFDAIKNYTVDQLSCEGCGFCFRVCPSEAIEFSPVKSGTYYECSVNGGTKFYYARLLPGEGNSGKLVSELKRKALENISSEIEWVIVDGPPGVGCTVNASIASADYVIIVTEPTLSGIHDLKRLVELLDTFNIRAGIVINKFDLNIDIADQICKYAESIHMPVLGSIPFDEEIVNSLIKRNNVIEANDNIRDILLGIWNQLELQMTMPVN